MKSTTPIRDLTAAARSGLSGNWGKSIGVMVAYVILLTGVSLIPLVGPLLAQLIFSAPLVVGLTVYLLATVRRQNNPFSLLFAGFNCFGTALCTFLLVMLILAAWMIPFLALAALLIFIKLSQPAVGMMLHLTIMLSMILLMLVLQMRYGLALYVVADEPSVRARQAIRRSVWLMKGNCWRLGLLWLRFTGWILLGIITFGIGFIWLGPYYMAATAAFYDDLTRNG
jgi:uncharacterized membrane protein